MRHIIFILLLSMVAIVSGSCGNKDIVEKSLYDYKTDYVGDNTKVVHIMKELPYREGVEVTDIELKTDKEPYGIRVFIQCNKSVDEKDFFKNAVVAFALIGNVDRIEYVDDISKEVFYSFDRTKVEQQLEKLGEDSIEVIGSSQDNIDKYLNQ